MYTTLKQEVFRFQNLLDVIHSSLVALQHAIEGRLLLTAEIEDTQKSLLHNQVPSEWQVYINYFLNESNHGSIFLSC